jgi:hypothetical protein
MEIMLARKDLKSKPKTVGYDFIEKELDTNKQKIFYFDRENSHKLILDLVDEIKEKSGLNVYHREIRFGLDESDYMYEVHVL